MPSRLKRYQTDGHDHFVTFSCYRRRPYLDTDPARTCFEERLDALRRTHQWFVFGYVLMPEHVHLLVSEPKRYLLATTLNVLKAETSKRLKGDRQQFWQIRYHDFNVVTQAKFVEKLRYLHRNPVERGLVANPEDWPGVAIGTGLQVSWAGLRLSRTGPGVAASRRHPIHRDKTAMGGAPAPGTRTRHPAPGTRQSRMGCVAFLTTHGR